MEFTRNDKKLTISLATLVVVGSAAWGSVQWVDAYLDDRYWRRDEQRVYETATHQSAEILAGDNTEKIDKLAFRFDISVATQRVDALDLALYQVKRQEEQFGETPQSEQQKRDLSRRLERAKEYRDCLKMRAENCEVLLDQS